MTVNSTVTKLVYSRFCFARSFCSSIKLFASLRLILCTFLRLPNRNIKSDTIIQ